MKTRKQINNRSGFTLIEMVGVLAVIAILAALLVPKIFAAINDSRYSSAVSSINSVKAASMSYFSKNKGFGTNTTTFDRVLVTENLLERPFECALGTGTNAVVVGTAATPTLEFDLNSDGTADVTSGTAVYVTLNALKTSEAVELDKRMDEPTTTGAETKGRVIWSGADGAVIARVYLAHY